MMEQTTFSTSLPTNWEERSMPCKVGMPYGGTLTDWRNGLMGISWKAKIWSLHLRRNKPMQQCRQSEKRLFWKGPGDSKGRVECEPTMWLYSREGQQNLELYYQDCRQQIHRGGPSFMCDTFDTASGVLCLFWDSTVHERHGYTGLSTVEASKLHRRHMAYKERLHKLDLFNPEKR